MSKKKTIKTAIIQMNSGENKAKNLDVAIKYLNKAVRNGARFILLPETFNFRGECSNPAMVAETIPGLSLEPIQEIAAREKVVVLVGSIYEKAPHRKKAYNSSILIDEKGRIKAIYRKIHLFDVSLKEKKILESKIFLRGKKPVISSVFGVRVGLSICYDLRFPELYRNYASSGVKILCVPASFTFTTGKAHWEVLLRTRAIENQCFVIAPNQCGIGQGGVRTYGNSMIIDPWGRIVARASSDRQEIIYAELNMEKLEKIRKNLPVLKQRKII